MPVNTPLSWRDAQSYCRKHHTDLASIRSPEQQRLISDKSSSVWIGLFLDSWQWSDKWNLNFRHWTTGYPSHILGSGDCAAMSTDISDSGKWFHHSCDQSFAFICYGGEFKIDILFLSSHYKSESITGLIKYESISQNPCRRILFIKVLV